MILGQFMPMQYIRTMDYVSSELNGRRWSLAISFRWNAGTIAPLIQHDYYQALNTPVNDNNPQ